MNIFKRIFGTPKDVTKILDGAIAGLDALVYTEEEKSRANLKISEWYLKYLAATQGQNLARRFIALMVVGLWVLLIISGIIIRAFSVDFSDFIFSILVDVVAVPFGIIIGFYFLAHTVREYKKG